MLLLAAALSARLQSILGSSAKRNVEDQNRSQCLEKADQKRSSKTYGSAATLLLGDWQSCLLCAALLELYWDVIHFQAH